VNTRESLVLSLLLLVCATAGGACSPSSDGDPLRSVPAMECAPACFPRSTPGLSGPSVCYDGCNYCRCTASGPRDCTDARCLDAGSGPTLLPWAQCSTLCTAIPAGNYFPDHEGPSACYDGCNACLCSTDGLVHCTLRGCPPDEDAGVDQGNDQGAVDQGP